MSCRFLGFTNSPSQLSTIKPFGIKMCWSTTLSPIIMEVENGYIWKVTILLEILPFWLPWLWEEVYQLAILQDWQRFGFLHHEGKWRRCATIGRTWSEELEPWLAQPRWFELVTGCYGNFVKFSHPGIFRQCFIGRFLVWLEVLCWMETFQALESETTDVRSFWSWLEWGFCSQSGMSTGPFLEKNT